MNTQSATESTVLASAAQFVAVNYITCRDHFREKFEHLFSTRAHAIDRIPGFLSMNVLRPQEESEPYLVVSYWTSEDAFKGWMHSPEFLEGHKRGFEEVRLARERGEEPPMTSRFLTYSVVCA